MADPYGPPSSKTHHWDSRYTVRTRGYDYEDSRLNYDYRRDADYGRNNDYRTRTEDYRDHRRYFDREDQRQGEYSGVQYDYSYDSGYRDRMRYHTRDLHEYSTQQDQRRHKSNYKGKHKHVPYDRSREMATKTLSNEPTPSTEYLAASLIPSGTLPISPSSLFFSTSPKPTPTSISTQPPRKLIALDLNGTLLCRTSTQDALTLRWTRSISLRPHINAFHSFLRSSSAWLDVMVWSSAQPHNVEEMVGRCFPRVLEELGGKLSDKKKSNDSNDEKMRDRDLEKKKEKKETGDGDTENQDLANEKKVEVDWDRSLLKLVWARDRLGLSAEAYHQKSPTIKDLSKPWNYFPEHGSHSTLLIDDSPDKARLQPWNHLQVPEYISSRKLKRDTTTIDEAKGSDDVSETEHDREHDEILLAVIGILSVLRAETNVAAWIRSGKLTALQSISQLSCQSSSFAQTQKSQLHPQLDPNEASNGQVLRTNTEEQWYTTPSILAYWVHTGRDVLRELGIQE